jgi:hypothetical protein
MSVNSTYFWSHQKTVRKMEVARFGMLKSPESPMSIGSSHNDFVSPFRSGRRILASELFLKSHRRLIKLSGRSLLRPVPFGLGARVGVEVIGRVGLFERECFYLQEVRHRRSNPAAPCIHNLKGVPAGWVKISRRPKKWKELASDFMESMVNLKWATRVKAGEAEWEEFWFDVHADGGEGYWKSFVSYRRSGEYARGLKLLKASGYSKSKHPLCLRSSFVYEAVQLSRKVAKETWWARKLKTSFVRAQLTV